MQALKNKLRKMIPRRVMYFYYLLTATRAYMYDIKRRVHDKIYNDGEAVKVKRDLTVAYHIVEKGLTMPETRPGFGKQVIINLTNLVARYEKLGLNKDDVEFVQTISVLKEYQQFHEQIGHTLDEDITNRLKHIKEKYPDLTGIAQIRTTSTAFFQDINKPFDKFCFSRYSVRNYTSQEIPLSVLERCVELAMRSPSFCNRQPNRVYVVKSAEKKQGILELQNGNRGFGHLAETLLVVTSVISVTKDIHERHENHLNGGMFIMTLINALHFHKIGACSLNWSVSKTNDLKMRKLINIPENEVILLVISCGYLPDKLSIASSPRKPVKDICFVRN